MKNINSHTFYSCSIVLLCYANITLAVETKGQLGFDVRQFTEKNETQLSGYGDAELYWESEAGNDSIIFKAFSRIDSVDDNRTHNDIREFNWLHYADAWELRIGIEKVFWGVTESAHLVDIINQTDSVESADGEEKLGQPMIKWSGINDWGVVDIFVLPYFRERTFNSEETYLGPQIFIDTNNATYESSREEKHTDFAVRYSQSLSIWDIGVSYFSGTSREAILTPSINTQGEAIFTPHYQLITQSALDVQATIDAWLWKVEAIHQTNDTQDYSAMSGGFEYTLTGIADSNADLGLLTEFHYDSRDDLATTPLQKDIFLGARLTLNDVQDTSLLFGVVQDMDYSDSRFAFIEASRRFGDSWVASLDARIYQSNTPIDPIYLFDNSDHITLDVTWFF